MEQVDDSHYLDEPEQREWCEYHQCSEPCQGCYYEETD